MSEGVVNEIRVQRGKKNWYWKLVGHNGEVLSTSEGYKSKAMCLKTAGKMQAQLVSAFLILKERKR